MIDWETRDPESPVIAVGSAAVDTIARPTAGLEAGVAVPAEMRTAFGGVARNVAENLARLEQPVVFLSVVGKDEAGDDLLAHLAKVGVDVSAVLLADDFPTGRYVGILHEEGGLQYGLHDMRISELLTPAYLRAHEDIFAKASAVVLDANLPRRTLRTLFSLTRRHGVPVVADPTSPRLAERLRRYLPRIAVITPDHHEAAALLERPISLDDFEDVILAARQLVARGVDLAVVTLAEFGLCYATSEVSGHLPALRTEIVDPTGAGDAFTAALLYGLLHGFPVDDAIWLGISAAALALNSEGNVSRELSLERLYDQLTF